MPTPEQLSAEKRKRVADICLPNLNWDVVGIDYWEPEIINWQWQALVSMVARMIEAKFQTTNQGICDVYCERLVIALATNNTQQIEELAYELIEREG